MIKYDKIINVWEEAQWIMQKNPFACMVNGMER